ncbi:MAG: hypothetical protein ISS29_02115 [Candidatus Marinimicrobia bacterium]|nr:hypothetical protein [Candidatus Neomarinimicrobiota bacterium]
MKINASPYFFTPASLKFGKVTCIIGGNSSGKSLLTEMVAGFSNQNHLTRLNHFKTNSTAEIQYFTPNPHSVKHTNSNGNVFKYFRDDISIPTPPIDFKIISPLDIKHPNVYHKPDLEKFSILLGIPKTDILRITDLIEQCGTGDISNIQFVDNGEFLYLDLYGTIKKLPFRGLSGSEQVRVLVEYAILAAYYYSLQIPTLLCLDCGIAQLDIKWFDHILSILLSEKYNFQTIVTSHPKNNINNDQLFEDCNIIHLSGERFNVFIEQDK